MLQPASSTERDMQKKGSEIIHEKTGEFCIIIVFFIKA